MTIQAMTVAQIAVAAQYTNQLITLYVYDVL